MTKVEEKKYIKLKEIAMQLMEETRTDMIRLARIVLPKASEDPDPNNALIGAMGCIPDTYEWFSMKFSFLERDDFDGFREWGEYLDKKVEEYKRKAAA